MKCIASDALVKALDSADAPQVLDVRLADDHEACRIPGSVSNCVFEIDFTDRLGESAPDKQRPVVVFGASGHSAEAPMAAEKLKRAGYADIAVLEGGMEAWRAAGHPVKTGKPLPPEPAPPDGRRELDLEECRLEWTGRNLLNKHTGTVDIVSGHLDFKAGRLTGGEITFDLTTLDCTDLHGTLRETLVRHLKDHDFLDVAKHPEGRLVVSAVHPVPDAPPGSPNLDVRAHLTLRGVTGEIHFAAVSGFTSEGKPAAQATFAIDRTRWGILYGSGRFFQRLAGHLVNDLIEFQARIVTA